MCFVLLELQDDLLLDIKLDIEIWWQWSKRTTITLQRDWFRPRKHHPFILLKPLSNPFEVLGV